MNSMTTIAAISLATFSLGVMAEQELGPAELDRVVAGVFSASAIADANGFGPEVIMNTIAVSEVAGVMPTLSGSLAQSVALANGPVKLLNGAALASGSATGTTSAVTTSQTMAFAGYGARTARSMAAQTSIATGAGSTASSSSQSVSVIIPY